MKKQFMYLLLCASFAIAGTSCKVNESVSNERTLYEESLPRLGSGEGTATKFGLGNLTRRQHSKLINAAREDLHANAPLKEGQDYVDRRIEVQSTHFFIFRNSRATFRAKVANVE